MAGSAGWIGDGLDCGGTQPQVAEAEGSTSNLWRVQIPYYLPIPTTLPNNMKPAVQIKAHAKLHRKLFVIDGDAW